MIASAGFVTVPTPGTIVAAVANLPPLPGRNPYKIHGAMFQAAPTNTGRIYIGELLMNKDTLEKLFAVLAIPTDNSLPSYSVALTWSSNGLSLNDFYIDAEQANDGVLVSYLEA